MRSCSFCGEPCTGTWCSAECCALDVTDKTTVRELLAERGRILARLMRTKYMSVTEEQALVGQVRVLAALVEGRGGRVPRSAVPPGAWHYTCDHQPEAEPLAFAFDDAD